MKVAYANAFYHREAFTGRNVHVKQFIDNATARGHEVWTWPRDEYPGAKHLPWQRVARYSKLREMDVIYVRLEDDAPYELRFATAPYRQLAATKLIVWEFNVPPEYGTVNGRSPEQIAASIRDFKRYGRGCDLAICVSDALADYARTRIGLKRVVTVTNGSDPDMFRPDVAPVRRVARCPDRLNVVWIGSADVGYHNFDLLRETAGRLWELGEGQRIQFHIIGKGLRRLRDMPANVAYHGPEDYEAMPAWLAAMDVGLCLYHPGTSAFASPLKLFDYMSSGLAVVSNYQDQVCQVFDQLDQRDLLFDFGDSAALASILVRLASDRQRLRSLGGAARQLVIDRYNWRRAVDETFAAITELQPALQRRNS
jgi:glycosyltransferase involved in cell wall biosynthesis